MRGRWWMLALGLWACDAGERDDGAGGAGGGEHAADGALGGGGAGGAGGGGGDGGDGGDREADGRVGEPAADAGRHLPDAAPEDPEGGACPPQGPYGTSVGDVAPDVVLMDCDGNPHRLHDLCGHRAGWIFEFAAWCPPCQRFARDAEAFYQQFAGDDLAAFFVISATANFSAPGPADCREIRERYGLTMPVLYDAEGALQEVLGIPSNDMHLIVGPDGRLLYKAHYAARAAVEAALREALGAE